MGIKSVPASKFRNEAIHYKCHHAFCAGETQNKYFAILGQVFRHSTLRMRHWPSILTLSLFRRRSDSALTVSTTSLKIRLPVSEISGVSSVVYPIMPTLTSLA